MVKEEDITEGLERKRAYGGGGKVGGRSIQLGRG